ncbi:MAG TPA: phosphoribosylamine--glycine ligase [Verrucomicrobiota bacterium]|nr:phosphoribosylamine--glycine ligase [Verrucomicrobiales bacterium]HRI14353.1 phosphoribosylamine--glycine ligase [Verrucomicrobiota bacterium]
MKLLVLGSGGREHALVWKLAQSPLVTTLWVAPGNGGTAEERLRISGRRVENVPLPADDVTTLRDWAKERRPDLTVVGPDNPLALGVVDVFQAAGLKIWGPNQKAAQFEASKAFSQEFMTRHGIPTARSGVFSAPDAAKRFCDELEGRCAVKADGLALGKGVLLATSRAEAHRAVDEILVGHAFGAAGSSIVVQELLEGMEISLHALCDGRTAKLFPTAQDHKRALDGDQGLNTGGMGTYSPAPFLSDAQLASVGHQVLDPWLRGCAADGIDFRGLLYPGVMLTATGPKVLEFNARFGDPEAQVYLTRLQNDLVELLLASVEGNLDRMDLKWSADASVCVVAASAGYPGDVVKGKVIEGLEATNRLVNVKVFHAGTRELEGRFVTNGGRVLGVTAWAPTLASARDAAYSAIRGIRFEGMHYRHDIAAKALKATKSIPSVIAN